VTDPFAYFPRHPDGNLRDGLYHRIPIHEAKQALEDGWIPLPPREPGLCDEHVVWMTWIECECGKAMPVPRCVDRVTATIAIIAASMRVAG
jgi:hypothetical protein